MQPRIIVLLRIRVTKISVKSLIEKIRVRTIIRGNTVRTKIWYGCILQYCIIPYLPTVLSFSGFTVDISM